MTEPAFTRADINLINWRTRPYSTWTFQNVSELVPSAAVKSDRIAETPAPGLGEFAKLQVANLSGADVPLEQFLVESESDALVIMRDGKFIAEWHAPHFDADKPHIIFSISKSVTGLMAGILIERGQLSLDATIPTYIPETAGFAYGDLTVRDLLNMTVAVDFNESYLDKSGDYDRYRRAMLWNPERADEPTPTLRQLICSLPRAGHAHGSHHAYRSPNADLAGLVVEAASGKRYAEFLEAEIWRPMGAHSDAFLTIDRAGNPRASGGLSMTARDLARIGELVRTGGNGILTDKLVADLWAGGDREVWAKGEQRLLYPGGSYLYYWYESGTGAIAGMGIHGQQVWVDKASGTVIVRMASEALPVNDPLDQKVIAMLKAVSAA